MQTPTYPVTITIGSSAQTTSSKIGSVLPQTIITRQSGSIIITAQDEVGGPFDLSSLNDTEVFAKPFNTSEVPVSLGNGVVSGASNEIFTITWVRDLFPAGWSSFAQDKDGAIVLFVQMEETGVADYFQWSTRFNVDDGDYTLDASVLPLVNLIFYYNPLYAYDNTTIDADPGAGNYRLNNTSLASVTEIYIADDNQSSVDIQTLLQDMAIGTKVYITNPNVRLDAALFSVSGAIVDNVGYTTVPVTFVDSGTTSFTNGTIMSFTFLATGVADGSITNAKLADMAQSTIKGRASGAGTGVPVDLTATQVRTIINVEDGADVTDETNVKAALDGATIANVTIATGDKVLHQDISDTDNLRTSTAQSIADLKVTELSEDTTPQLGGTLTTNNNDINFGDNSDILNLLNLDFTTFSELTIATGVVTATQALHKIDTEADAATDDLVTITVGVSNIILLILEDAARVVTLKDGTGNLDIGADIVMDADTVIFLAFNGTSWNVVGGIGGGAGSDTTAIHDNVAAEITAIAEKVTPTSGDFIIIEDGADSDNKKKVNVTNLPTGGGGEANTVSNVGGFSEVSKAKAGIDFPFRTLQSSDSTITITTNTNDLDLTTAAQTGIFRTITFPAGSLTPRTTNGAASGTQELPTNDIDLDFFDFDAATDEAVQVAFMMPDEWDLSTVKFKFMWKDAAVAGTGNVVWGVRGVAVSNDDPLDTAFGTAISVTDAFILAGDNHITAATAAVTIGGTPVLEDLVILEFFRDADNGSDTYTQDARLINVTMQFKESTTIPVIW